LSRQAAIRRMVEEDMGVGIVPLQSVKEDVDRGKLVTWWIEGAEINWELGLAQLSGGYESPILHKFVALAHRRFASGGATASAKPIASKKKGTTKIKAKRRK
jgi:DNA-binding transcriptional LysR family regulator